MSGHRKFSELRDPLRAPPEVQDRIEEHRRAMQAALALAELRRAHGATQTTVAEKLGVSQANVSRVEHQGDVRLSTVRDYVAALGGRLEVRAIFPDQTVTLDVGKSA